MRRASIAVLLFTLLGCNGSPSEPRALGIAGGRWSDGSACLNVAGENEFPKICRLTAGCGQGQFIKPDVRSDGTFDADGTYGIVAGPTRQDPLPPAHFKGSLTNTTLTLTVVPSSSSIPPATYTLHMAGGETCPNRCV